MSLFGPETDDASGGLGSAGPVPGRRSRRERIGWTAVAIAVVIGLVFALLPSPYVIQQPGPVFDTLGTTEVDGEDVPLITIPDEETFPTEGTLDLLTVSAVGRPGATPGWLDVAAAWFDPRRAVVPVETLFPPGLSEEDRDAQNTAQMVDSQQDAIAAALVELGYDFPRDVVVQSVAEGAPAEGVLEEGDVILGVDGTEVHSVDELRDALREHGTDTPAQLAVRRDGETVQLEATPEAIEGQAVLGVGVRMHYEFPIDVEIRLDDVGGPSAGMMFALGIVDKLTPGAMNGGENVAGTGTIDSDGSVGPIGGIRQKLWGAEGEGADWFLAPEANCDEVVGHVPDGLEVFAVSTLDDARSVVEAIGEGGDLSSFARCEG
ncbi:PDZ domain-containing protein [Agromyces aurantiacus]|uniref:endopeptidase La n=1 Tax=Agromyces aurantiacus TaxID=165814 RepID=A0ABV9RA42_9MICO|nr:PDZ domain-containing protein [Agromyces aurantiacus]MBM7505285.1 PDZ domain-containing protein [Agromyces aurantiacus]